MSLYQCSRRNLTLALAGLVCLTVLVGCVVSQPYGGGVPATRSSSSFTTMPPGNSPSTRIIHPGEYNPRTGTIQHSYADQYTRPASPAPTYRPSYTPTYRPSYAPTYRPSYTPTYRPSYTPTYRPSYR